jgi:hypothetical protein
MNLQKSVQWAACFAAAVLLSTAPVQAGTITTADGNGADTYGSNDSSSGPGVVHGAEDTANVRSLVTITSSGPPNFEEIIQGVRARVTMLRFDMTTPGAPTEDVRLKLIETFGRRNRTIQVYGLNDGPDDNWDEATVSYSNMPGVVNGSATGTYAMDPLETTFLGEMNVIDNRIGGVDTPQAVVSDPATLPLDDFLAMDTNGLVTLFLTFNPVNTDSNPDYRFATKENATYMAPALIPEPASLALVLFGVATLHGALRRRASGKRTF